MRISKLTRVKVLLQDAMGYDLKRKRAKDIIEIVKALGVEKITFRTNVRGPLQHQTVTRWLILKITDEYSIHLSGGEQITLRQQLKRTGLSLDARIRADKVVSLVKENIKWTEPTKRYWQNYLRNRKTMQDTFNFLTLRTLGGLK